MEEKSQGAFEYVLLLAGILLVVVMAIVILRSSVITGAQEQVNSSVGAYRNATALNCDASGYCS
ncbi:hypothetical protein HY995_05315 [Candidatus Micrarchaeota archaeon]|nr:hypothetical protein [Candidatus Micrarchaeota archaeon]MBI5177474.1 hypothetical protein [Candidatus Micrarchaeota archaeon]